jgi:hypothetical protein
MPSVNDMDNKISFKKWFNLQEKDNRGGNRYKGLRPHLRRAFTQTANSFKRIGPGPFTMFR